MCQRLCNDQWKFALAGPPDRRPLPSSITRPRIPSPSADHANTFISRPFSFRLVQPADFAFTDAQSIPLLLMWTEKVIMRWSLLCRKQVTFRLSSRFFGHSLSLRHCCLLERNFLERKIIIFLERSCMINAEIEEESVKLINSIIRVTKSLEISHEYCLQYTNVSLAYRKN